MVAVDSKPVLEFDSVAEWEHWLECVASDGGVRLRLRKKSSTKPGPTYPEALDVALCFGWIDGQIQRLDADYFLQVFTPRRRNSPWSKINREHVERLITDGKMHPSGQTEIERARSDGRWDAAYRMADREVPPDLQAVLDQRPAAAAAFAALSNRDRFAIVFRLNSVKRIETRQRKLGEFIEQLEHGSS